MPASVERAKDWWEGKAPRERRLLAALGATLIVCLLLWLGMSIRGGLRAIEKRNQEARNALVAIEHHRQTLAVQAASQKPVVAIPETQLALDTYLDPIIKEVGLESPAYPAPKETQKGPFTEVSIRVALKDLSIAQLTDLLEKVETKNPVVATTELHVKGSFRNKENLDVDFMVVTYYKKGAGGARPVGGAAGKPAASGGGGGR